MSANTGRAPTIMIASAEYAADSGVVITSSPGPTPSAAQRNRDRVGAGADAHRFSAPQAGANSCSNARSSGPEHEPAARDHAVDGVDARRASSRRA